MIDLSSAKAPISNKFFMFNRRKIFSAVVAPVLAVVAIFVVAGISGNFMKVEAVDYTFSLAVSSTQASSGEIVTVTVNVAGGEVPIEGLPVDMVFEGTAVRDTDYFVAGLLVMIPEGANSANFQILILENQDRRTDRVADISVAGYPATKKSITILGEGDCVGEVMGKTSMADASQEDHGATNFNSHEGAKDADPVTGLLHPAAETVNLMAIDPNLLFGYAPDREQAACVTAPGQNGYPIKGYVFNDNLGFISMFCDGKPGVSGKNFGIECGEYTFGVNVGNPTVGNPKVRELSGFAWNAIFGYISFRGVWDDGAGHTGDYGVIATQRGASNVWDLSGYGFSQAGVYLKFDGTAVELSSGAAKCAPDDSCCINPALDICKCTPAQNNDFIKFPECYCAAHPGDAKCVNLDPCLNDPGNPVCQCGQSPPPDICKVDPVDPAEANCEADFLQDGDVDDPGCCLMEAYMDKDGCDHEEPFCYLAPQPICMQFKKSPELVNEVSLADLPVADCNDGYEMELMMRDVDGNVIIYQDGTKIDLWFMWADSVKSNQVDNLQAVSADSVEAPFDTVQNAGVKYKPVHVSVSSRNDLNGLFNLWEGNVYAMKSKISSCAPTSGGNVSKVETIPSELFDNEKFLYPTGMNVLPNNLILKKVLYKIVVPGVGGAPDSESSGVAYPPSKVDIDKTYLRFKPLVEVSKLATKDFKDVIGGYRDIPIEIDVGVTKNPKGAFHPTPTVDLILTYNKNLATECRDVSSEGKKFNMSLNSGTTGFSQPVCDLNTAATCLMSKDGYLDPVKSLFVTPVLPGANDEAPIGVCTKVPSPALYSTVRYDVGEKTVKYYSNKLPRTQGSALDNPAAIIHGTIYSSLNFSPDASQTNSAVSTTVSNAVRDAIHKRVTKYIKNASDVAAMLVGKPLIKQGDANRCVITAMGGETVVSGAGSCDSHKVTGVKVGEEDDVEYADYFYGVDVVLGKLDVSQGMSTFGSIGKRIIVVEGGDVLIGANVYDQMNPDDNQLVILVFGAKDAGGVHGGDVYIADDVTTLSNVVIVADGAIHPFLRMSGLEENGIYKVFGRLDANGYLKNPALDEFYIGVDKHGQSSQLFIKGAVSARTVSGISSILNPDIAGDKTVKHLTGFYDKADAIFQSIFYDWNMFRLYKGGDFVPCDPAIPGLYTDLSCGKCLNIGNQIEIANGGIVCNAEPRGYSCDDDVADCGADSCKCDGIQNSVNSVRGESGDLVKNPAKESALAPSYKPFYLYYTPISSAVLSAEE